MKHIIAFLFATFLAGSAVAQDQTQNQLPPSVQTDTTSGWQVVFSNSHYSFGYLQFISQPENKIVYAGASNGSENILLKSTDLGVTWDTLPTPVPGGPVVFTTQLIGYAGAGPDAKIVWKTIDGGQSWLSYPRNSVADGPIAFANQDTGLVFGPCCTARTTDAGNIWQEIPTLNDVNKNGASFANSQVGYVVGSRTAIPSHPTSPDAGFCEKTIDGGATWTQVYTGTAYDIQNCQALSSNILIIAGSSGLLGRTLDGGLNWDTITLGDKYTSYYNVSFADSLHGLATGAHTIKHGTVANTSDGGKTWVQQYFPTAPWLTGVAMINDSIALVCGDGNIYRTVVGGNFSSVTQQHSIDFQCQIFPNPTTGSVAIQYVLPTAQAVSFSFYNLQGATIGSISEGMQDTGPHQITFDGSSFSNGVYYFRLTTRQDFYIGSFTIQK